MAKILFERAYLRGYRTAWEPLCAIFLGWDERDAYPWSKIGDFRCSWVFLDGQMRGYFLISYGISMISYISLPLCIAINMIYSGNVLCAVSG